MSDSVALESFRRSPEPGDRRLAWIREHLGEEAYEKTVEMRRRRQEKEIRRRRQWWRRLLRQARKWWGAGR